MSSSRIFLFMVFVLIVVTGWWLLDYTAYNTRRKLHMSQPSKTGIPEKGVMLKLSDDIRSWYDRNIKSRESSSLKK